MSSGCGMQNALSIFRSCYEWYHSARIKTITSLSLVPSVCLNGGIRMSHFNTSRTTTKNTQPDNQFMSPTNELPICGSLARQANRMMIANKFHGIQSEHTFYLESPIISVGPVLDRINKIKVVQEPSLALIDTDCYPALQWLGAPTHRRQ